MKGEIVHERQLITENVVKRPDPLRPFSFLGDYRRSQKPPDHPGDYPGEGCSPEISSPAGEGAEEVSPLPLHPGRRLVRGYL